ncbi:MAG: hypothetical protein OER83_08880 [Flavobacteriaceae bacterium]|nr:hypothetical protein [Flavobacteriaceae bacterium]MDH3796973.1 hypothetical protein [Flavobacteriaceae bacterium]
MILSNPIKKFWFILILCLVWNVVFSQRHQKVVYDKEGIKIYNPPLESGFISYTAYLALPGKTVHQVRNVFQDYKAHTEWIYRCLESEKISETDGVVYLYQVSRSNWPFKNRDHILVIQILDDSNNKYRIRFKAEPTFLDYHNRHVRIDDFYGEWEVSQEESGVLVKMFTSFNPKVNFPKAFFRTLSKRVPLETLRKLKAKL